LTSDSSSGEVPREPCALAPTRYARDVLYAQRTIVGRRSTDDADPMMSVPRLHADCQGRESADQEFAGACRQVSWPSSRSWHRTTGRYRPCPGSAEFICSRNSSSALIPGRVGAFAPIKLSFMAGHQADNHRGAQPRMSVPTYRSGRCELRCSACRAALSHPWR